MAKKQLSEAEKYRLERKKRIAKEKKKKNSYINRNREKVNRAEKIVGIVVGAAAVLAITFGLLSYFGVFAKTLPAVKVGDKNVPAVVLDCAYAQVKNQVYSASQQYSQQYNYSFYSQDTPSTDPCVYDQQKTWGEYFEESAKDLVQDVYTFKDAEGNALTEDQVKEINESISSLEKSAKENEYSLNAYLLATYGNGVTKNVLQTWLEDCYKAENAKKHISEVYEKGIKDSDINKYYKDNIQNYKTAGIKYYQFPIDTSSVSEKLENDKLTNAQIDKIVAGAAKKVKADADKIYSSVKANPSKFASIVSAYDKKNGGEGKKSADVTATGLVSNMSGIGTSAQKWVASGASKGSLKLVYSADYENKTFTYDLVLIETPAAVFNTINVRHILVQPESASGSQTYTDEEWAAAKTKADEIYAEWKKNPTEKNFSSLVKDNSADTGSTDNGGLYENVKPGDMVTEFNDWCFASGRKHGDNAIVKTDYGYHIMYFVKANGPFWKTDIPDKMASEYLEKTVKNTLDSKENEVTVKNLGWSLVSGVKEYKKAQKSTTTTTTAASTTKAADSAK